MTATAITVLIVIAALPGAAMALHRRLGNREWIDPASSVVSLLLASVAALCAWSGTAPTTHAVSVIGSLAATTAAVTAGGAIVRSVLIAGGVTRAPARTAPPAGGPDEPESGPLRGGRVIGYLERLAVVGTLLLGWPEGLAIILAVKSLARFPELRAPHASEQFIMGTFASVLWACGMAGVGHLLAV
ncbi:MULTISPECIES: hypothetical protein [unclassified Gordonia (in: high G+C Gram-positive bacteria)]|uniref:hypothetical protein n=1 Tax=unclassified Gordonia (in: high G+C Gram-positive bacteria) TaxID=2657482 RepID=UPI0009AC2B72|nr:MULTISPECIES: hypothetical protein [unclassified Gordonia (in: high G+C Gram-positive bacteria)]MDF3281849.1 hypothetical protein [Gordonia sp. N1V]OPX15383.1 hypothetical protein B1964_10170 [Gordonia sp. i37]